MYQVVMTMFGTDIKGKIFDNYADAKAEADNMNEVYARNNMPETCRVIKAEKH